jgi:hypothetical protein
VGPTIRRIKGCRTKMKFCTASSGDFDGILLYYSACSMAKMGYHICFLTIQLVLLPDSLDSIKEFLCYLTIEAARKCPPHKKKYRRSIL